MQLVIFASTACALSCLCLAHGLLGLANAACLARDVSAALPEAYVERDSATAAVETARRFACFVYGVWTAWGLSGLVISAGLIARREWARRSWLALVTLFLAYDLARILLADAGLWPRLGASAGVCFLSWWVASHRFIRRPPTPSVPSGNAAARVARSATFREPQGPSPLPEGRKGVPRSPRRRLRVSRKSSPPPGFRAPI